MKKNILIYFLVIVAGLNVACNDFLDKDPNYAIPEEDAMKTLADVEQHMVGLYSTFLGSSLYSGSLTLMPDIQCDFVYAVNGFKNVMGDIWRWDFNPSSGEVGSIYSSLYSVITTANFIIDNAHKASGTLNNDTERNRLARFRGEAFFARALAYSELLKLYCDAYDPVGDNATKQLGVVITTTYSNEAGNMPRSDLAASFKQVRDDLDSARLNMNKIAFLEDMSPSSYYFSPHTITALEARVCLYMHDYQGAVDAATELIKSDVFKLDNAMNIIAGNISEYSYMWGYDEGNEVIWRVGMTPTNYGSSLSTIFHNYNYVTMTPDYVTANWVLNLYDAADRRASAFFAYVSTNYPHGLAAYVPISKYFSNPVIDGSGTFKYRNMPKVFRLSEQYLIRAEANYYLGEYADANEDLTTLRKSRIAGYGRANHSAEDLLKEIKNERVKELYMEGFRLYDLKRWGDGFKRVAQEQTVDEGNKLDKQAEDPRFTWPIPQHELDANPAIQPNPSNGSK